MRIAVVGAGWAGLAAAVRAVRAGHAVTLFEAAAMPGGRARSDDDGADAVDNGQHILLGGYARTLALLRDVGVDAGAVLARAPLALTYPDGGGLALPAGATGRLAMARALHAAHGFGWRDKLSLAATAAAWHLRGFRAPPGLTVDALVRRTCSARVRARLIEPLCVAALNTPIAEASAAVFLAVMRDSLFSAPGAADLLLPQAPLAQLLPLPAVAWLRAHGADVRLRTRVAAIDRVPGGWTLRPGHGDGRARPGEPASGADKPDAGAIDPAIDADAAVGTEAPAEAAADTPRFDHVVLATPATEAARLAAPHAPAWAANAAALAHEPIVTVTLRAPHRPWPAPMLALEADAERRPAQFAFKLGAQPATGDRVTLVVSAAGPWLARGAEAVARLAIAQYRAAFAIGDDEPVERLAVRADRRATFRCVAGIARPAAAIAPGLVAAGDYVDGPYPATLEAAVIAGEAAAAALGHA